MASQTPPEKPPKSIGGFAVEHLLGRGGMGNVYACRDEQLGRIVAIKVLKKNLAVQPAQAARFLREAQAMAKIQSPNVVTVHQVGEQDGRPFLVMELLEGKDLSELVKQKGPLSEKRAITYLRGAIQGLEDAARAGVIHRDVKPANLFVENERVKLTDFGLSLPLDADAKLTQEGLVVGTPHYLAPEIARGGAATEASDIYGLGATLFELLLAHPPYPGRAALDVVSAHLHQPVPSPREERRDLSRGIDKLIQRMMQKEPERRYQNYAELRRAIAELLSQNAKTVVTNLTLPTDAQQSRGLLETSEVEIPRPSQVSLPNAKAIKTQNLAVLLLDIDKYSARTGHADGETASQWIALFDGYINPIVREFNGKRGKTVADGILATFSSPTDAVLCGMALQDQFAEHNQNAQRNEMINARVALSAGEVRLHKSDILGEPVNLVTRIERMAENADVIFSDAIFATMGARDLSTASLGEHRFKGISRAVHVYRIVPEQGMHPYGGAALEQTREGGSGFNIKRAISSTFDAPESVANKKVSRFIPIAVGALVALGMGVGIAFVSKNNATTLGPKEIARLESQVRVRSPDENLALADAYRLKGDAQKATLYYSSAAKENTVSLAGEVFVLERLSVEKADETLLALYDLWPDPSINDALRTRLNDSSWWTRHNALSILERRGRLSDEQRQSVGLLDLKEGDSCARRKWGLALLSRVGKGPEVLEAFSKVDPTSNDCLKKTLAQATRQVRKRSKSQN